MRFIEFLIRMIIRYIPDRSPFWRKRPLVFHTYFDKEYAGTPDEVIRQLHLVSKEGMDCAFSEWWEYQRQLFKRFGISQFPDINDKDASMKVLRIFAKEGVLLKGSLPDKKE